MLSCWHPSAKLRPSFSQLVESVSNIVDAMQRQVQSRMASAAAAAQYVNSADQTSPTPDVELDAGLGNSAAELTPELDPACRSTTV